MKINKLNTVFAMLLLTFLVTLPWLNPCESEDSSVCTWNAKSQGNSVGNSFTDFYGVTIYHFNLDSGL